MIFISVDLPAPFSPRTAWISPAATSRSMSAFATTVGYDFVMPRSDSSGGAAPGEGAGTDTGGAVPAIAPSAGRRGARTGPCGNARGLGRHELRGDRHGDRAGRLAGEPGQRRADRAHDAREALTCDAARRQPALELRALR